MHRNARLLHKHNFQSQHVSPQQWCVMKLTWMFDAESFTFWRPATVPLRRGGFLSQLGHKTKSTARGSLLFAHRKRREMTTVEKSSQFLCPFSKESNFQGIQGSVVLAAWLFYYPACDSSLLCIFCICPNHITFSIAPWTESKAYFRTMGASWRVQGLFSV